VNTTPPLWQQSTSFACKATLDSTIELRRRDVRDFLKQPSLSQVVLEYFSRQAVLHNYVVSNKVVYVVSKHLGKDAHAIGSLGAGLGSW